MIQSGLPSLGQVVTSLVLAVSTHLFVSYIRTVLHNLKFRRRQEIKAAKSTVSVEPPRGMGRDSTDW